jgi:hypothetical protein
MFSAVPAGLNLYMGSNAAVPELIFRAGFGIAGAKAQEFPSGYGKTKVVP